MVVIVGLTGNVACGKSTVARYWHRSGHPVLDTDRMAATTLEPGTPGYREVLETFAEHCDQLVQTDGLLNRKYLGHIVFSDRSKKRLLEKIVWPKVYKQLFRDLISALATGFLRADAVVIVEIPMLFESGSFTRHIFDSIVTVSCEPPSQQMARLMARNPEISEADAKTRLTAQMPQEKKRRLANFVIDNSGTVEETQEQADQVLETIKMDYKKRRNRHLLILALSSIVVTMFLFYNNKLNLF